MMAAGDGWRGVCGAWCRCLGNRVLELPSGLRVGSTQAAQRADADARNSFSHAQWCGSLPNSEYQAWRVSNSNSAWGAQVPTLAERNPRVGRARGYA